MNLVDVGGENLSGWGIVGFEFPVGERSVGRIGVERVPHKSWFFFTQTAILFEELT